MRVQNQLNITIDKNRPETRVASPTQFNQVLRQASYKAHTAALDSLFAEIEEVGEQLVEKRTISLLSKYKRLIKQFIEEAVQHGLAWRQEQSYVHGRLKQHHLIERIDEELLSLTEELLYAEEDQLQLLAVIGEIKGLLIELYA